MKICLEKGGTHLSFDLPETKLYGLLKGRDIPGLSHTSISQIIAQGIQDHCPKEIASKKIALIIPDDTRLWARADLFVGDIISALGQKGVKPSQIKIIIALGTHGPIPQKKFARLCGQTIDPKIEILNSAGLDETRLVTIGTTSAGTRVTMTREAWQADHIIIFGGILHHMLAGFGGGRKYILPGISGENAIQTNHALAMDKNGNPHPMVKQGICAGNPVSEDMQEGAEIFLKNKTCTYAAVAANGRGELFYASVGDLHSTFQNGCSALDAACCVDVQTRGDFVLFSAGEKTQMDSFTKPPKPCSMPYLRSKRKANSCLWQNAARAWAMTDLKLPLKNINISPRPLEKS
ncbi:MAG: DUF2088 domain-containing protein [Desulfobacter sp.]|nr:MAG: DUF2088 domain-containing protein [Desulfobacter sp.]